MKVADQYRRPMPSSVEERKRIEHQAARRRVMEGRWQRDANEWALQQFGPIRYDEMGEADISSNFMRAITREMAALYDTRPIVAHPLGYFPDLMGLDVDVLLPSGARVIRQGGYLERGGLWALMPRHQQMALAVNEAPLYIGWSTPRNRAPEAGVPRFLPMHPDCVEAEADPADPGQPVYLRWLRIREVGGEARYTWDEWDLRDADMPTFRTLLVDKNGHDSDDITRDVYAEQLANAGVGDFVGPNYPWRRTAASGSLEGEPWGPWVVHHREHPTTLWNERTNIETLHGTYNLAAYWTMFGHGLRNASNPQRWIAGGRPEPHFTEANPDGTVTEYHVGSPTSIAVIRPFTPGAQVQVGQWQAALDPASYGEAVAAYQAFLAANEGVDPADLVRTSGDPRSGYALAISQAGKLEQRRRFAPVFRPVDQLLVERAANLINLHTGLRLPEEGYLVEYEYTGPDVMEPRHDPNPSTAASGDPDLP